MAQFTVSLAKAPRILAFGDPDFVGSQQIGFEFTSTYEEANSRVLAERDLLERLALGEMTATGLFEGPNGAVNTSAGPIDAEHWQQAKDCDAADERHWVSETQRSARENSDRSIPDPKRRIDWRSATLEIAAGRFTGIRLDEAVVWELRKLTASRLANQGAVAANGGQPATSAAKPLRPTLVRGSLDWHASRAVSARALQKQSAERIETAAAAVVSTPADLTKKRELYRDRVAEFDRQPPLETTKSGTLGDRQWATQNSVPRSTVEQWRREEGVRTNRGAPKRTSNSAS